MTTCNLAMTSYLAAFVDEMQRAGINDVVISPGSRSTPLALLLEEHPRINTWIHVDERSAGFFALGLAKSQNKPAAVLCTSGTAAANYLPAVTEASYARVPLVVLTADRPHELREIGAPQAIDQIDLYAKFVKWFVDMPLPEDDPALLNYVRTTANRAIALATIAPMGPVHLNFPLREPLIPDLTLPDLWSSGRSGNAPYVKVKAGKMQLAQNELSELAAALSKIKKGLIICGPEDNPALVPELIRLAGKLGFPLLADPLSQIRSGAYQNKNVISCYDTFLRYEQSTRILSPGVILRFGAMPVSKHLFIYLKAQHQARQIVIDDSHGWRDPALTAETMIFADPVLFCRSLIDELSENTSPSCWPRIWQEADQISRTHILDYLDREHFPEARTIRVLQDVLPDQSAIFVGNSMPVRDLDTFFGIGQKNIRIMANRGANGIDGVVSTALGASVSEKNLVLLIGDLSFFHDLNALLISKLYPLNLTIILINNDGGGIFSFLPQAKYQEHFEKLFGTPLGIDFSHAVKMFGGSWRQISPEEDLGEVLQTQLLLPGLKVLEVLSNRRENYLLHQELCQLLHQKLACFFQEAENASFD